MSGRPPLDFRRDADRFDAAWYRAAYPDLPAGDDAAALAHFIDTGSREGRQPNADFAPQWYLGRHLRVAAAVEAARLCGPYHDYLLRLRDGLPRRPAPAEVAVGIDLANTEPHAVDLVLRLAGRAPRWDFWLLAPPGRLPPGSSGANVAFAAAADRLPAIDLWLDIGASGGAPATVLRVVLGPLMEQLGHQPTDRSPRALDRTLEALRSRIVDACPVVPTRRQDSGPVHVDPDRVPNLRVVVQHLDPTPRGGGIVVRSHGETVAELPPPPAGGQLEAPISLRGSGQLWLTLSPGLLVELAPGIAPETALDVVVTGGAGLRRSSWQRTLQAAAAVRTAGLVVVDPPAGLDLPAGSTIRTNLAEALADRRSPAMLVPVGVRPFPQAVGQAAARLASGGRSYTARSAVRHPDGHLAPWPDAADDDPELLSQWRRGHVTVLSAVDRRRAAHELAATGRWQVPAETDAASLAAIDAEAWPSRIRRQPERAPGWMRLDARPDGGVVGRLRLRGDRLAAGGRLVLTGSTAGALAAPCLVVARPGRRPATTEVIDRLELPTSGEFAWPIELPTGRRATDSIEIVPAGAWRTAQDGRDARPLLFRLVAVRYRPAPGSAISPSAASRAR